MVREAVVWSLEHNPVVQDIHKKRSGYYTDLVFQVASSLECQGTLLDFGAGTCIIAAALARLGFRVIVYDDLADSWIKENHFQDKILEFAQHSGIEFHLAPEDSASLALPPIEYDAILIFQVIEHLPNSPRAFLNEMLKLLRVEGFLFVAVPNAANLRKRIDILRGRTNYPPFKGFYWYPDPWRGHIREYVYEDLALLSEFLGLTNSKISTVRHDMRVLNPIQKASFNLIASLLPGLRDTWLLVGQKPEGWSVLTQADCEAARKASNNR